MKEKRLTLLKNKPDVIDEKRIREYLQTKWLGNTILYAEKMDSTNNRAKQLGEQDTENGTVVVTGYQTSGRGRRGNTWVSPEGNCYFSILLRPEVMSDRVSMITLVSALALTKAIKQVTGLDAMIKWPNDIIVNSKKLCGILTESSMDQTGIHYVVVGIGINCNQIEFSKNIAGMATSIRLETGKEISRSKLFGTFLNIFETYYEVFLETEDLSEFLEEYNNLLVNRGKEVKIIERDKERILTAIGIDEKGGLIVKDGQGRKEMIISGEVSVRGLYGYV